MGIIKLLDCTLRDGGYLNDWEFGNSNIINIYERLVSAKIDVIEIGFLDDRRLFDYNRSIFPDTLSINKIFSDMEKNESLIVGMIDYGTCRIENIMPAKDCFLDGIRVIFKKDIMREAISFCEKIKELGYKTFVQAVSITSYGDQEFQELIDLVNILEPYAFSIVDTYGLLHRNQLMHYYQYAEIHLKISIEIGYHSHNNFQLAYANCIELIEHPPAKRNLLVDGTLYGMGKGAGNAPIELLTMYLNEKKEKHYHNSQLLEAIDVTILDIFKKIQWGYSFDFFLAASHDCHPNYVSYLRTLKKLSVKSISEILDSIEVEKRLVYDEKYLKDKYIEYQIKDYKNMGDIKRLQFQWSSKKILLLGPGKNITVEKNEIDQYIKDEKPILISVNFLPENYDVNYVFISNAKRYVQLSSRLKKINNDIKLVATSNVTKTKGEFDYTFNFSELLDEKAFVVDNPMIMILKILNSFKVESIALAGFDGYQKAELLNYADFNMEYPIDAEVADTINSDVLESMQRLNIEVNILFITKSKYAR